MAILFSMTRWIMSMMILLLTWSGQVESAEVRPAEGTLSVSAVGKVFVPPDKALIQFAVETTGKSLRLVQEANAQRIHQVMTRLNQLDIPDERIQTSSFQVIPRYPNRSRSAHDMPRLRPQIIGYTVRHALTVEVRDLTRIGRIVDEALHAGANRFDALIWGIQDEHPVQLRTLTMAAHRARQKADALARALGVTFLRVLEVRASQTRPIQESYRVDSVGHGMALEERVSVPVAPGELTVQSTVTLTFEIDHE